MARRKRSAASPSSMPPTPPPVAVGENGSPPVHTIRMGEVRASIWERPNAAPFTLTVDRLWRDPASGEWREDRVFRTADAQYLARAATDALNWMRWQERRLAEVAPARHSGQAGFGNPAERGPHLDSSATDPTPKGEQ